MKSINKTPVFKSLAIAGAVSLAFFGSTELRSSQGEFASAPTQSYVLSVSDAIAVTDLVVSVGGQVSSEGAFGVVTANLTSEQLELVSRSASVSRISKTSDEFDNSLSSVGSADGVQVAGWYWGR